VSPTPVLDVGARGTFDEHGTRRNTTFRRSAIGQCPTALLRWVATRTRRALHTFSWRRPKR
jgi:hypothetical protein